MAVDLRMLFNPTGDLLAATKQCEADVFYETYGNTPEQLHDEYDPYESASVYIGLADADDHVVGSCRLIRPGPAGLKTIIDAGGAPWFVDGRRSADAAGVRPVDTWDVATISVRRRTKSGMLLSAALYHGLVLATRANAVRSIVMIMDERARRLLTSVGFPTQALPGTAPGPYLGSPTSTPLWGHVDVMIDNQRRNAPDAYRLITQGIGLTGIAVPPLAAFELDQRPQPATFVEAYKQAYVPRGTMLESA